MRMPFSCLGGIDESVQHRGSAVCVRQETHKFCESTFGSELFERDLTGASSGVLNWLDHLRFWVE